MADWQVLFDLIPIIETSDTFGKFVGEISKDGVLPYPCIEYTKAVNDFHYISS